MTIDTLASGVAFDLKLARNVIVVNIPAYDIVNIENRDSIDYYLGVYLPEFPGSNDFKLLETLEAKESPIEIDGSIETYKGAFFEIDDLLRSFLKPTAPDFEQKVIKPLAFMTTRYYCQLTVKVDGVSVFTENLSPDVAYYGGVNERDYADYNDVFFSEWIGKSRRFLSYGALGNDNNEEIRNYVIGEDQPEMLYWLHNYSDEISELRLKVVAKTVAGSEINGIALSLDSVEPMKLYSIPINLEVLKTVHAERAQIASYTIWLTDENGNRLSEARSYSVDPVYRRNCRYIYFLNSLGVYECLRITGEASEAISIMSQNGESFTGYSYLAKAAEKEVILKEAMRLLTINLQWSSRSAIAYLTDFALSLGYFYVGDRELLPMRLENTNFKISDDTEDWAGRQFVFEFANKEKFYSNLPVVGEKVQRATRWVALAASCELDSRGRYNGMRRVTVLELIYADTGEQVLPRKTKPNLINDDGYIVPVLSDLCVIANTPFLSDLIQVQGTFKNTTCGVGTVGGPATITIPKDAWGSLLSKKNANDKAQAEWRSIDTQAYADANGSCNLPNQNGLRAKFWNYVIGLTRFGPNFNFNLAPVYSQVVVNPNAFLFDQAYPAAANAGVQSEPMVMEMTGYLKPSMTSNSLRLISNVDDGVRIWLNGVLILDSWFMDGGEGKDRRSSIVSVVANEIYPITIQTYNEDGFYGHILSWAITGGSKITIPNNAFFYI